MKTKETFKLLVPVGMMLATTLFLAGCAPKKNIWGDTKKGLILSYRMPEGKSYKYKVTADVNQSMEINTQKLEVTLQSFQEYTFLPLSPVPDPISLKVIIDTMHLYIKSPMRDMTPGMEDVIGKSLEMKLSAHGVESDLEEAKSLTYSIGPETRNLGSEFQGLFPNLPESLVQTGDSWSYNDTIIETSGDDWLGVYASNTAILDGYETVGGRECARIVVTNTGTIAGSGNIEGLKTETTGSFTGTDRVWFDYKAGILVKMIAEGTAKTLTQTSGDRNMIIPASRQMRKVVELKDNKSK